MVSGEENLGDLVVMAIGFVYIIKWGFVVFKYSIYKEIELFRWLIVNVRSELKMVKEKYNEEMKKING